MSSGLILMPRGSLKVFWERISNTFNLSYGKDYKELFYIGGADVLPPPLSKEDEADLIEQYMAGSEAARSILIERNLRLVVYIAKKFENTGVSVEDLISIGTIGLIKAINTFKPERI